MKDTKKQNKIKGILIIAVIIAFFAVISILVGKPMIKTASNPEQFRDWIDTFGIWSRVVFIGMMVLQNVIAFIPGEPLEICAGYAFGTVEGTLLCIAGSVIGSAIVFCFVRAFGMKLVEFFFDREKLDSLKFLRNTKRLTLYVFIFTFIPGTPKDLMSYFVGLTEMKLSTWLLITAFGRIPSIITSAIGGDVLGNKQYEFAVIIFLATLAISVCGLIVYRHFRKSSEPDDDISEQHTDIK